MSDFVLHVVEISVAWSTCMMVVMLSYVGLSLLNMMFNVLVATNHIWFEMVDMVVGRAVLY